jgi:hypothetical protein
MLRLSYSADACGWLAALSRMFFQVFHNNIFNLPRRLLGIVAAIGLQKCQHFVVTDDDARTNECCP